MRLLVCGSRHYGNWPAVYKILDRELEAAGDRNALTIINGGAPGVDLIADEWAHDRQVDSMRFPARWTVYGRGAGPLRNQRMLNVGQPNRVIAIHTDPGLGRGTADMVRQARLAGLPVNVYLPKKR